MKFVRLGLTVVMSLSAWNGGSAANAIHIANDFHYGIGACGLGQFAGTASKRRLTLGSSRAWPTTLAMKTFMLISCR